MGEDWWPLKYLQALKSYESMAPMSQTLEGLWKLAFIVYDVFFCISSVVTNPRNTPVLPTIEGKFDFQQLKIIKAWA